MNKKHELSKKTFLLIIISVTVIGTILYLLADRYLIEHVEYDTKQIKALNSAAETTSGTNSTVESTSDTNAVSDDWNYSNDSETISIKKVETGTGSNKITYFVADVTLKSAESLQSAFAKNQFGTNIVEYTSEIAEENNAVFAIDGDYYGFRDDGVIIRNGQLFRDEPVRDAVAFFKNGLIDTYNETEISSSDLLAENVLNTFSFGPILVQDGTAVSDFDKVAIDKNIGNHSIQDSNPRTGVGMISANHFVFVVVDGRKENYSRGMTLTEFASLFESLGCTEAYNFDGGGSSTMYFKGHVVNNPLGKGQERGVSDILYIK